MKSFREFNNEEVKPSKDFAINQHKLSINLGLEEFSKGLKSIEIGNKNLNKWGFKKEIKDFNKQNKINDLIKIIDNLKKYANNK